MEHQGGQWNVAVKENEVYFERVSEDNEQLFDDSLAPEEARQLARLLTKHADKISESSPKVDESDEDSDESDEDSDEDDSDEDDSDEDSDEDSKDEDSKDEDSKD